MSEHALLLVTDGRWPLDADGAQVAREFELATGTPVNILRVPDGRDAYRLVSAGEAAAVVVATVGPPPAAPPVGWTRPVCWHVTEGCDVAWNTRVDAASTISEFVASTRPTAWSEAGWSCPTCSACCVAGFGLMAMLFLLAPLRRLTGSGR